MTPRTVCAAVLLAAAVAALVVRVVTVERDASVLTPTVGYDVTFRMTFDGTGRPVRVSMYLPVSDDRQRVTREASTAGRLVFSAERDSTGTKGGWEADYIAGSQEVAYTFRAEVDAVRYDLDPALTLPTSHARPLMPYLAGTAEVQVDDPVIAGLFQTVVPQTDRLLPVIRAAFDAAAGLRPVPFKGRTDAVTAARLGEASCNGKSRLFLALARRAGIPGRLVGGLVMTEGTKRVSHQWVELYVSGYWVPFDALNGHFASLPANYLALYYGDEYLFAHTPNIGFDYQFAIDEVVGAPALREAMLAGTATWGVADAFNPYRLWNWLTETGLSIDLLLVLLLLPFAATVVVFARNVIGLGTHGVFLPALIGAAALQAGLAPTLGGFAIVTVLVAALHVPLSRWGVLHTPKLALMLLGTVVLLVALTGLSDAMGWGRVTYAAFLPLVIVTASADRFAQHLEEEGAVKALRVMVTTLAVAAASYFVMTVSVLQAAVLAFPELLLAVAAVNLWLGGWVGIRVAEYHRFRWLLDRNQGQSTASAARTIAALHENVLGINERNAGVIHLANPRRHFALADDKCATKDLLEEHGVPVPRTLAVFEDVGDVKRNWTRLEALDEFVVKPARGRAGNGILVLERAPGGWRTPSERIYDRESLQRAIADIVFGNLAQGVWDAALVEERVRPHPFFEAISGGGLPDLRIITHHGQILQAMVRLPSSASDGKANLHQGALGVGVDIESGRLGAGYNYRGYELVHPDSGVRFEGLVIPAWPEIVRIALTVAKVMPLKYLGVDIVIDRERGPLVMEANARPGIEIQNVNRRGLRPLLVPGPIHVRPHEAA